MQPLPPIQPSAGRGARSFFYSHIFTSFLFWLLSLAFLMFFLYLFFFCQVIFLTIKYANAAKCCCVFGI